MLGDVLSFTDCDYLALSNGQCAVMYYTQVVHLFACTRALAIA